MGNFVGIKCLAAISPPEKLDLNPLPNPEIVLTLLLPIRNAILLEKIKHCIFLFFSNCEIILSTAGSAESLSSKAFLTLNALLLAFFKSKSFSNFAISLSYHIFREKSTENSRYFFRVASNGYLIHLSSSYKK